MSAREEYIEKVWTGEADPQLRLVNPTEFRFEHLVTQMKWRLKEGQGETIYELGVEDYGLPVGLTDAELRASVHTLERTAERLGATLTTVRENVIESETAEEEPRRTLEILVRKVPDDQMFIDIRLAVLGNLHAGKTTLLGVLTHGELDDGRGRAGWNRFRHLHEMHYRRQSCISHAILGFNTKGEVVDFSESRTAEEVGEQSSKVITLIDVATHQEHLKTTTFGLTRYSPDFTMLVVSANKGLAATTKEQLGFALAFNVPIFVVVTKIDLCCRGLIERTISQLEQMIKSRGRKIPVRVSSEDDVITAAHNFDIVRYVAGKFQTGHFETFLPLLTSLGLFKDADSLLATNRFAMATRKFRTSHIGPFSANIMFTLYACDDANNTMVMKLLVNEEEVIIPACGKKLCLYEQVKKYYKEQMDQCDIKKICGTKPSGSPSSSYNFILTIACVFIYIFSMFSLAIMY